MWGIALLLVRTAVALTALNSLVSGPHRAFSRLCVLLHQCRLKGVTIHRALYLDRLPGVEEFLGVRHDRGRSPAGTHVAHDPLLNLKIMGVPQSPSSHNFVGGIGKAGPAKVNPKLTNRCR